MTKITPYTALCDIFRSKEQNSDNDAETSKKEEEEKTPPKQLTTVQKINNSCQTQTLQDNCFERIIKSNKKQPNPYRNIKFHDDNFQILRADYCTYSKDTSIYHIAEKPEDCEENFTRRRKRRRLSPTNFIKKILSRDPSPTKCEQKDGATSTDEEEIKENDTIQNDIKPMSEKETNIYPPLLFNYQETSKTPLPKFNYKITKSTPSTRAARIENKVNTLYRTLSGLKQTFQKKYHFEATELTDKCLCRHCGALAVVKESLKSPMIFDSNEEENEIPILRKKKRLDEKEYFKLSIKLKILEERLRELEELTYIHKSGTGLRHDMYTQCQGKNNSKGTDDHKTCGLSFFLPPNIKQKMFGKKANPKESGSQIQGSDFEMWKAKRVGKSKRKKTGPTPKLRCHDYVNNKKEQAEKSTSLGFQNTNVQVVECKESQKEVNSTENEISILQKELSDINHHQITEILLQLLKNKTRISEGKVVRFELNSKNTNLQYESGVLYNSSVLPDSLLEMLNNTKKENSSLTNCEINPDARDTEILYNRDKAFISNSRQNIDCKNENSLVSNSNYNESNMIKKLIQESHKTTLRSEIYKEKQKSKINIDETNCMPVKKDEKIEETKKIKNQLPAKRLKSQIPRRYVLTSNNKQEHVQNANKNQSKLNSILIEKDNKHVKESFKYPNTKIPTRDRSRSHSEKNKLNSEDINDLENAMYQNHLSRKTDYENRSKLQFPKHSIKFNKKINKKNSFDKRNFQVKFFSNDSPIRQRTEKTENYQIRRKCYFPDVHQYVNKNYKDSSGTNCTGDTTSTIYNIEAQRRSRSFSTSFAKMQNMRVNFKEEEESLSQPKRKCNITLPNDRSQSQNSDRSESPTKKPAKNFIKINKEKCAQIAKKKYEQKITKILERKQCGSEKSENSSWKSSVENITTASSRITTRNNSEKDLTGTTNISETTGSFFGVLKKYSKQFLRRKSKTASKIKKGNKKRYLDNSSELKIVRISRIPVIADDKYRRKSRLPRKLKKSYGKNSTKYQLVFKATPKFDKGCFCRPNMIDRSTMLSKKQIISKKTCKTDQENDKLSINTMVLNNIESTQESNKQSLNKIIILNHPHYGAVPTEISDKCTTSSNTLIMQNTLENLVPSYIHNDFHLKNSKIKAGEVSSSKETNKSSIKFDKMQDTIKKKSSILKMFKKNNYEVQKVNYQVFVSPQKSKSKPSKKQIWDNHDQSQSTYNYEYEYSNPYQNQEHTYNNVPHCCNLSNRERPYDENAPCCSNWPSYVNDNRVIECNECPEKRKCNNNKSDFGDAKIGITSRIKSAINAECSCGKQKTAEIKTPETVGRYEMPQENYPKEHFPKVEPVVSKEKKPEVHKISKIPRRFASFKADLEEKLTVPREPPKEHIFPSERGRNVHKEGILSQELVKPTTESVPLNTTELVDEQNKTYYGCDCLANTVRSKCNKCKQKHIEELRKKYDDDDDDDDEDSFTNFENHPLTPRKTKKQKSHVYRSILSRFSKKSSKSLNSKKENVRAQSKRLSDKGSIESATGNIFGFSFGKKKSQVRNSSVSDDSDYSFDDDDDPIPQNKPRKSRRFRESIFQILKRKSNDSVLSHDISHYEIKNKNPDVEAQDTEIEKNTALNSNDLDFSKFRPSKDTSEIEIKKSQRESSADIYQRYISEEREKHYLNESNESITPLPDSQKIDETIPRNSYTSKPDNVTIPRYSNNVQKPDETVITTPPYYHPLIPETVQYPNKSTPHYLSDQCTTFDVEDCFSKCQAALQSKHLYEKKDQCECPCACNETKSHHYESTNVPKESNSNQSCKCSPKSEEKLKKKFSFFRKNSNKCIKTESIEEEIQVARLTEEHYCPEKCTFNTEARQLQENNEHKTFFRPIDSDGPCVPMSSSCMFKFEDPEPCPSRPSRNLYSSGYQTPGQSGSTFKTTNYEPEPQIQFPSKYSYGQVHSPQQSISTPHEPYMNPYICTPEIFLPPQCLQNCPYMFAPKPVTHEISTQSEVLLQENKIQYEPDNIEDELEDFAQSKSVKVVEQENYEVVQTISEDRIIVPSKQKKSSKKVVQIESKESVYSRPTKNSSKFQVEARPVKQKRYCFGFKRKRRRTPSPPVSQTSISKQKDGRKKCGKCANIPFPSNPSETSNKCGKCEYESISSLSMGMPRTKRKTVQGQCKLCEHEPITFTDKKNKRKMGQGCARKCELQDNVSRRKSSFKNVKSVTLNVPLDEDPCTASASCIKSKCSRNTGSQTFMSDKNSGSTSKLAKSVKDSLHLIAKCSLCDACRDKVQSDNAFETEGLNTCLLPMCNRVKEKITSTFPCKYFKNFTKKSEPACHPDCKERSQETSQKYCRNNTYHVNNVECNYGYFGDYDQKQTLEASSMNTSVLNLYYNVQSFYFENEDDWDWSYSEDDVILTPEEKKRYLLDKLHLLHNFQDQINNSSNYGAFE